MLSPATYYKSVPKPMRSNLNRRKEILSLARGSKDVQKGLMEACKRDVLFWINLFVWQYNPNAIGEGSLETGPFITWDFQDAALISRDEQEPGILWCIENRKDLVIVKSREMGASYLCLLVILWLFLFHPWKKILLLSRNQETVYRPGDSDCLFWKLEFIADRLPEWMTRGRIKKRKLTWTNPLTNSAITGQATTAAAGVGGRAKLIFVDEFSRFQVDYEVLQHTASTSGCRIFNGTHLGTGTAFYELTDPDSAVGSYIKKLWMHWSQHPDKYKGAYRYNEALNQVELLDKSFRHDPYYDFVREARPAGGPYPGVRSPWYDDMCRRLANSRGVAMDLDIDPRGSVSQVFDSLLIHSLKESYGLLPRWQGEVEQNKESGEWELVKKENGPLMLWVMPSHDGKVPSSRYGIGGDISMGLGSTLSCLSIGDAETGEKVGEYATANESPDKLAPKAVALGNLFHDANNFPAKLAWEIPGPGSLFGKYVLEAGYANVYYRSSVRLLDRGKSSDNPGWASGTKDAKKTLLKDYEAGLKSRQFINRHGLALDECLDFKFNERGDPEHNKEKMKNDPTGARDNHGDRVIADALCWKMLQLIGLGHRKKEEARQVAVGSLQWRRDIAERREKAARAWA